MEYWQNLEQALVIAALLGTILGCGLAYWFLRHYIAKHVYEDGFQAGWKECQTWMTEKIAVTEEVLNGPEDFSI